jgi:transaldolase
MPPATVDAFRDHGTVALTIDQRVDEAEQAVLHLPKLGISMLEVTDELEQEGVQKFADSYDELLATIAQRRAELVAAA